MLYALPSLDRHDHRVLDEIEVIREALRIHLRAPRQWEGQLRRNLTARAIAGSNTIEGYAASVADVEDIMLGEAPVDAGRAVSAEIEGYRQAMTYIQRLADAGEDFRYSKELLNALHFMMQGHHLLKRPGWWRTGAVYVTSPEDPATAAYTAPAATDVPSLTAELVAWLNDGDPQAPALVRAAMAHLNLVAIHPWSDGNGRMSRALQTLMLAREGILAPEFSSIEEWLGRARNTYRYYDVLADVGGPVWTPDRDTHAWVRFCLRAHHQQAQTVRRQVETTAAVWTALDEAVAGRGWPDRMLHALYPAVMAGRVRRATYEVDAELSEQQAQRDLRELVNAEWLTARGQAQGRYYTAGKGLPESVRLTRSPQPLRDPYDA
ncbi:Fic family protein [Streptomyces corynorhini]|uniref:Fic family protein n=1 Tax=Streptomyces corynorhini TaxID=2282652 RepID=A0A370BI37_9ACTN|nr:Fic family protein [Streptomyces corynorhini]RDG39326.1 Fic family protein [Streptomyces corynorhini]